MFTDDSNITVRTQEHRATVTNKHK